MKCNYAKLTLILVSLFCFTSMFAQRTIDINNSPTRGSYAKVQSSQFSQSDEILQCRKFDYNSQLKMLTPANKGDVLLLDLFEGEQYTAVIKNVTKSYDGIVGITAQLADTEFGYCFISISDKGISMSVEIPERDKIFMVYTKQGSPYLTESSMSQMQETRTSSPVALNIENIISPNMQGNNIANSPIVQADENAAVTLKVLFVYTEAAELWATTNHGADGIDFVMDQAIQRANTAMINSGTNVTVDLVYKYKNSTYVERNTGDHADLYNLMRDNDGELDEVHDLRVQYEADFVSLIADVSYTGGVAFLMTSTTGTPTLSYSLNRVQQTSWTYTMVHELGHNLGCAHHKAQGEDGLYTWSHGWGGVISGLNPEAAGRYSTIMTYESGSHYPDGQTYPRIGYFSSPLIELYGQPIGDANDGDNVRTMKLTKGVASLYAEILDVRLASLDISYTGGTATLEPAFDKDITQYNVTVPANITEVDVAATVYAANSDLSQSDLGTKQLNAEGSTVLQVEVFPNYYTGTNSRIYTVTVSKSGTQLSNDATLSNLTVSAGTLTPAFDSQTTNYTVTVPYSVSSIDVTGTANHAGALVTGNVTDLALNTGNNPVIISVTAEDGQTMENYHVNIYRLSNDATLFDLSVSEGTLTPAFDPQTFIYTVNVDNNITDIFITALVNDVNATVAGDGPVTLNVGNNPVIITVTAEDGTTLDYYVTITRAGPSLGNDATLSSIYLSEGTLVPFFDPYTISYTVYVDNNITEISISGFPNHASATIAGNVLGMPLVVGNTNVVIITVTAEDATTTKDYTITIVRADLSNDATLADLTVSEGTLSPVFDPNIVSYSVNVANSVTEISVTGVANDAGATVIGNVTNMPLIAGTATIVTITVTAEDGVTTKDYAISVTRAGTTASNDATLADLTVSHGTLTPVFDPQTFSYTVDVHYSVTGVTVTGTANDANATVIGDGLINLSVGANTVTITVTAEDGTTTQDYLVTINRAGSPVSDDATLISLDVSEEVLTPAFDPLITNYTVDVANNIANITLTALPNHPNATHTGDGMIALAVGANTATITVTAQDGVTTMDYIVTITRADSPLTDATLAGLTVSEGTLAPVFNPQTTSYAVSVDNSITAINVTGVANNPNATVTGNVSGMLLNVGLNTVTITVTAEDGTTTKDYTVNIYRASTVEVPLLVWLGNSSDWHDPSNWGYEDPGSPGTYINPDYSVPTQITDVIIPGDAAMYPEIVYAVETKDIMLQMGAELKGQHLLAYEKANVEFNLGYYSGNTVTNNNPAAPMMNRDRFYLITSPLKDMVVGDFFFGGKPAVYVAYAEVIEGNPTKDRGDRISLTRNLPYYNVPLTPGFGFAYYADGNTYSPDQSNLDNAQGVVTYPRFMNEFDGSGYNHHEDFDPATSESTFWYYYSGRPDDRVPADVRTPDVYERSMMQTNPNTFLGYRLAAENNNDATPAGFALNVNIPTDADGNYTGGDLLVGNPYISHFDFANFYLANRGTIKNYFRLWDGRNAVSWLFDDNGNFVTSTDGSTPAIAPMQAFFVAPQDPGTISNPVMFGIDESMSAVNVGSTGLRLSNSTEQLRITANNNRDVSSVVILRGNESEGVSKLFSMYEEVPELYLSLAGQDKVYEIAEISLEQETVHLGLQSSLKGRKTTFTFEGMESLTENAYLYDDATKESIKLAGDSYSYEFISATGTEADRFSIVFVPQGPTGIDDLSPATVQVYAYNQTLYVQSSSQNRIQSVKIYSIEGQTIANDTRLNTAYFEKSTGLNTGIYLVEVTTERGKDIKKIIIK